MRRKRRGRMFAGVAAAALARDGPAAHLQAVRRFRMAGALFVFG
jgi:hypothetical protein